MAYQVAIDIGNTRTKLGLFEGKELLHSKEFNNSDMANNTLIFNEYEANNVIISSVNSKVEGHFKNDLGEKNVVYLNHQTSLPIKLLYQSPETLGKDRIASAVAAHSLFPDRNVLSIDAGTCITYDLVNMEGSYLGGAITPGVQMRLKSMNDYTDKLPLVHWDGHNLPKSVGNTTITSMLSGVINGCMGEMKEFIHAYQKQYKKLFIVLTGGDANFFEKALKNGIFADPNLVLIGLNEILLYNCE